MCKGEVIGLSGLLGSGRSELARTLYGADKADEGEMKVKGKKLHISAPIDAMKAGMAFCPENRKDEGIIADLSVRENIIIALQAKQGMFKLITKKDQEEFTRRYVELLNIKTADMETPIKQLSGGNQQKVIIGRWLLTNPEILLLDEPTRGIDVGAKYEIYQLIIDLANKGKGVIMVSSEMPELLGICDRILVMSNGKVAGIEDTDKLDQEKIMTLAAKYI